MPIELKIPEVGESITEVQIAEWLKAEGDAVQKDEPVAVIDSEKTTFELSASESGTLSKILRQAGETVKVGEVIGHLEAGAGGPAPAQGGVKPAAKSGGKTKTAKAGKGAAVEDENDDEATGKTDGAAEARSRPRKEGEPEVEDEKREEATGKAEVVDEPLPHPGEGKAAEDEDEDEATGKPDVAVEARPPARSRPRPRTEGAPKPEDENGDEDENEKEPPATPAAPRATKAPTTKASADGEEEFVPMSMLRRTVARRLVEAKQQMAMLTTFNEVDMSAVQTLRDEHKEAFEKRHEVKLGFMSFFVKAAVDALKQFPQLNAEVRGNDIVYHNYFNIGVALATERGLVVPVLRNAGRMSFADVEKSIGAFATRAKESKLTPDELEGATFTITNGGVFGSLLSTPIINPPQSGILGMHTIQERPVAVQGQVVIRPMMYLALTYDHRLVDGREAVLFIRRIKEAIESPARMLLEV